MTVAERLYQHVLRLLRRVGPATLAQMIRVCLALGASVVWLDGLDPDAGERPVRSLVVGAALCVNGDPLLPDLERRRALAHALAVYLLRGQMIEGIGDVAPEDHEAVADVFERLLTGPSPGTDGA